MNLKDEMAEEITALRAENAALKKDLNAYKKAHTEAIEKRLKSWSKNIKRRRSSADTKRG